MKYYPLFLLVVANLLFSACEHKPLCIHHNLEFLNGSVVVDADYDLISQFDFSTYTTEDDPLLTLSKPQGLRVLVYNIDYAFDINNLPVDGGEISLSEGEHSLLCYNNDTEYIVFDGLSTFTAATASTRVTERGSSYRSERSENIVNSPDMLFCGYIDYFYESKHIDTIVLPVTLHPRVFPYIILFQFDSGFEHVAIARGAISGMASSIYLRSGDTPDLSATFLYDCSLESYGALAKTLTFGIPNYHVGEAPVFDHKFFVTLEVRLQNGEYQSFDFDVTDQLLDQPRGGIILVDGIDINPTINYSDSDTNSSFEVNASDWGEFEGHSVQF